MVSNITERPDSATYTPAQVCITYTMSRHIYLVTNILQLLRWSHSIYKADFLAISTTDLSTGVTIHLANVAQVCKKKQNVQRQWIHL